MPLLLFLCLGPLALVLGQGSRVASLLALYLAASILVAALAACGAGVSDNAFFEVVIAGALAAGYVVSLAGRDLASRLPSLRLWAVCVAAFAATFGPGVGIAKDVMLMPQWMAAQRQRGADTWRIVSFTAAQKGPALCETPVFCYWAGKRVELDTFNFEQGLVTGKITDDRLVQRIIAGRYAAISLDAPEGPNTLTPAIMAAVHEHY